MKKIGDDESLFTATHYFARQSHLKLYTTTLATDHAMICRQMKGMDLRPILYNWEKSCKT